MGERERGREEERERGREGETEGVKEMDRRRKRQKREKIVYSADQSMERSVE